MSDLLFQSKINLCACERTPNIKKRAEKVSAKLASAHDKCLSLNLLFSIPYLKLDTTCGLMVESQTNHIGKINSIQDYENIFFCHCQDDNNYNYKTLLISRLIKTTLSNYLSSG